MLVEIGRMNSASSKIIRRTLKVVQLIRRIYYAALSNEIPIQGVLKRSQPLLITGTGRIIVNGTATVGYFPSPFYYNGYAHFDLRHNDAIIEIGNGVLFNNNTALIADGATIYIREKTLIGLNFTAMTSDAHGLKPNKRTSSDYPRENVYIGMNVFVGNNVRVLKGVTIGDNSVIGSGSVVVKDIPPNVIAAGSPCKVIKAI